MIMALILVFVLLLFCSNVKSTSIETTTVESSPDLVPTIKPPRDVFDKEMDADCNPKYEGYLVHSKETTVEIGKKTTEYKCFIRVIKLTDGNYGDQIHELALGECKFKYQYCTDGSLRRVNSKHFDVKSNNMELCVRNEETAGAYIKHIHCSMVQKDPEVDNPQKWKITEIEDIFQEDGSIINQKKVNIKNKDGKCLTVVDKNRFKMEACELTNKKQKFYFRSRGTVVKQGSIYNRHQNECVLPKASSGSVKDKSMFGSCDDNTAVKYYTNGEIVAYDKCFTSLDDNYVGLKECSMDKKQKWVINKCNKNGSCIIMNASTRNCLKHHQDMPNVYLESGDCAIEKNTFFDFVNGDWNARSTDWVKIGCNQDGKISVEVKNEKKYETAEKTTLGVGVELSGQTPFKAVELKKTFKFEWEKAWEESFHASIKSSMTCDHYEDSLTDSDKFTHGCIWQLKFTTFNRKLNKNLEWRPPVVKCTRSGVSPKCDPFMKCGNKECSKCIYENEAVNPDETFFSREPLRSHLRQKNLRRLVQK